MMPQKIMRAGIHRSDIQPVTHMPDTFAQQCRRRGAVSKDTVELHPVLRTETGVKIIFYGFRHHHRHAGIFLFP